MIRLIMKLFFIALGITLSMIVMGVLMGMFPAYKHLIGGCFAIFFIIMVSFAFRGSISQTKQVLQEWAAENGYKVVKIVVLPGRFGWALFTIEAIDGQGQKRKGYGYCRDIYSSKTVHVSWRP